MSVESIVNYVMNSPQNTNKMVLKGLIESEVNMNSFKMINLNDYNCETNSVTTTLLGAFVMLISQGGGRELCTLLPNSKSFVDDITTNRPIRIKISMPQGIDVIATAEIIGKSQETNEGLAISFTIFAPLQGEYMLVHTSITASDSNTDKIVIGVYIQKPELL